MIYVKTHVVARRSARGGSAQEHLAAALRCLYRHAVSDGLIKEADNPVFVDWHVIPFSWYGSRLLLAGRDREADALKLRGRQGAGCRW